MIHLKQLSTPQLLTQLKTRLDLWWAKRGWLAKVVLGNLYEEVSAIIDELILRLKDENSTSPAGA